jgi:dTDP-4-amino-4,6-dideoxygalactose transaminase
MNVPFLDLKTQYSSVKEQVLAAIGEVLDSQVCILGPKVAELEKQIASLSGCRFGVGVSSGTDALLATLMALEIGTGDEVITTPFTFFASAGCIARQGALPVFVDIDPLTYNLDAAKIEAAITAKTRAIIPVHLYGQMCDMDPIMELAAKYNLAVIEDAAQAISSTYKGRKAGSIGVAGCFSFFPSKNLGGVGDGGMIVTNDSALYERLAALRAHGSNPKYYHKYIGGNFRLDPLQAAVLLVKLPFLDQWSKARRHNAAFYNRSFAGSSVGIPRINPHCTSIFNQYVVRVDRRAELMEVLKHEGIGSEIYYPVPMHLQECFVGRCRVSGSLVESEAASQQVLALPVYPELTDNMLEFVANTVLAACNETANV